MKINKSIQIISLPNKTDPDSYLNNGLKKDLINLLKKPDNLLNFIFETSSSGISFNDADQKINYDKYLDDIISSIKDKKIQYFYKSELKSLFFRKLKNLNQKNIYKKPIKKITSLKRKQIFSFIAGAINHKEVRSEIVATILKKDSPALIQA